MVTGWDISVTQAYLLAFNSMLCNLWKKAWRRSGSLHSNRLQTCAMSGRLVVCPPNRFLCPFLWLPPVGLRRDSPSTTAAVLWERKHTSGFQTETCDQIKQAKKPFLSVIMNEDVQVQQQKNFFLQFYQAGFYWVALNTCKVFISWWMNPSKYPQHTTWSIRANGIRSIWNFISFDIYKKSLLNNHHDDQLETYRLTGEDEGQSGEDAQKADKAEVSTAWTGSPHPLNRGN